MRDGDLFAGLDVSTQSCKLVVIESLADLPQDVFRRLLEGI